MARGHVYLGSVFDTRQDRSGHLFVFEAAGCGHAECAPEWSADLLGPADGTIAPVVSADTVYMGSTTRFGVVPNGVAHLFAFPADGCGAVVCRPRSSYDVGDGGLDGGLAVSADVLYASAQGTPRADTVGVLSAYPARGCGAPLCRPLWTGVNFASGFESPPVVVNGLVFVAKGPAAGFPVDAAVLSYDAAGCSGRVCLPLSFTELGTQQFYLGAPIAVADGTLYVPSGASGGGANLYALRILD